MSVLFVNNAVSRLAASVAADALALSVSAGDGAKFPSPTGDNWFPLTLVRADGIREIVRCNGRTGDVLTVVRAQEGTAAVPLASGDRVELRLTAAALNSVFGGPVAVPTFGSLELVAATPFVDFHASSSADDYTSRIIAAVAGELVIRSAAKEQAKFTDDRMTVNGHVQASGLGFFDGGLVRIGKPGVTAYTDYGISGNVTRYTAGGAVVAQGSGFIWHSGNFDPASKVTADSILHAGFASNNVDLPYFRRISDNGVYYLQPRLGFTPVQQGGGVGQGSNAIKIGFDGGQPRITVDASDFGRIHTDGNALSVYQAAAQGAGGIGTYAMLLIGGGGGGSPGSLVAGASCRWASAGWYSGTAPGGTWRIMGWAENTDGDGADSITLCLRVS